MKQSSKLLLAVMTGGIVLGAGLARYASPTMNFAPSSDWRERYRTPYSDQSMQFVDTGPIDLSPALPPFGANASLLYARPYEAYYSSDEPPAELGREDEAIVDTPADMHSAAIEQSATEASVAAVELQQPPNPASQDRRPVPKNDSALVSQQSNFVGNAL